MRALPAPALVPRVATLSFVGWVLAWITALGGFTLESWLSRPLPTGLPWYGGRTDVPQPAALVVIDGLREDALWGDPSAMPWLRALADQGVGGVATAGDPTLTAACVRTLLTGRLPDLLTGLKNFTAPAVEGTWMEAERKLGARIAHGGDAAVAQICAPWLDPADVLAFPDRGPVDQGQCDAQAVPFILSKVAEGVPVISLHLTAPDHAGHKHGALGPEYRAACARVDAQIREVLEAFRARHPRATVLVAADHGVSPAGTHGGGESAARRAPFVLVGPVVTRAGGVELSQAALAPTLAAALGLPQPPLADAPPATELLNLPAVERQRALDAHVRARVWIAQRLGGAAVDPIERRRAELAVTRMGSDGEEQLRRLSVELDLLTRPSSLGLRLALIGLALLGLAAFVRCTPLRGASPLAGAAWLGAAALVMAAGLNVLPGPALGPLPASVACALALLTLLALSRPRAHEPEGGLFACLAALPVLLAGAVTLKDAVDRGRPVAAVLTPVLGALALVALLAAWRVRWRGLARRVRAGLRRRPTLGVALAGAGLGVVLAKRPFVDPFVPLNHVVALAFLAALAFALTSRSVRRAERWVRLGLLSVALLLVGLPLAVTGGGSTARWTEALPTALPAFLALGLALMGLLTWLLPRPWHVRPGRLAVALGLAGLSLAILGRMLPLPTGGGAAFAVRVALAFGPQALALAALLASAFFPGTRAGALAARTFAALALTRRLTASDAEWALVVGLVLGGVLLARLPLAHRRRGLALVAIALLLTRTAAFHAAGGTESRSTVDVGTGFYGLEEFAAAPHAPGTAALVQAGGGVTWQMVVAGLQVALRFALPWLVLLSALAYAARTAAALRALLTDLALSFAARATALVLCLWALTDNGWWVGQAQEVVSLGAADLVLLLAAALLVGAFRRDPAGPAPLPGPPAVA